MKERIAVLLFSIVMVLGSLATAAWMIATGQVVDMDGIFLLLVLLLFALVFSLCIRSLFSGGKEAVPSKPAAAAAPKTTTAPAQSPATQSQAAASH
jgi:hypothetical protein